MVGVVSCGLTSSFVFHVMPCGCLTTGTQPSSAGGWALPCLQSGGWWTLCLITWASQSGHSASRECCRVSVPMCRQSLWASVETGRADTSVSHGLTHNFQTSQGGGSSWGKQLNRRNRTDFFYPALLIQEIQDSQFCLNEINARLVVIEVDQRPGDLLSHVLLLLQFEDMLQGVTTKNDLHVCFDRKMKSV